MHSSLTASKGLVLALTLVVFCPGIAAAQKADGSASAPDQFDTLGEFSGSSAHGQVAYVTGFVDGLESSAFFDPEDKSVARLKKCVQGMTQDEITDIVREYANENPARWELDCTSETFFAINEVCTEKGLNILPKRLQWRGE
jgi:hypothetical protein